MSKKNFYNIIDFGLSKIRFVSFDNNLDKKFSVSTKVYANENLHFRFEAINKIIKKAEKKISSHINEVVLILDNQELLCIDISLKKNLDKKLYLNILYDSMLLEIKQLVDNYYTKYDIAHMILDKCIIDEKIYYELPKNKIETNNFKADFKIICFPKKLINEVNIVFNKNNLIIKNIFCASYIRSLFYLKKFTVEKISFLEIGYKRSSLIIYRKGKLKFIQSIPIGGYHITNDISKIFNLSFEDAEKIKKLFNKSENEFSYKTIKEKYKFITKEFLKKNISIDLLKKVILYRVQEIIDLSFNRPDIVNYKIKLKNTELFLIGDGSLLFKNNLFHLNDKFEFKSINFYEETDEQICNSGLVYDLNNYEIPITIKKQGLFEKFFNFFSK